MRLIPATRRGMLVRFFFGALIVIAFTAATTAVAGLLQFKQLTTYLNLTPALKTNQLVVPNPGDPQTLLLIGSDHRYGEAGKQAHTDTMMLARLNPDSSTINLLSIPRDLKVDIPEAGGIVTAKLNEAFSVGGPNLLIKVIKQQVFPGLHVNHTIIVTFGDFEAMVNAIGCVYTDVDHRYYNNTALDNYSSLDLQPGYQRLCGADALSFVRFRHTDNDLVRNARQQDFVRWAKSQFSTGDLLSNKDTLERTFGANTQTDHNLHTLDGVINLFNLVVWGAGHATKQIPFPAIFQPCGGGAPATPTTGGFVASPATQATPCYVTADPVSLRHAFTQFMTPTKAAPSSSGASGKGGSGSGGGKGGGKGGGRGGGKGGQVPSNLVADGIDGRAQAAALRRGRLPVYYPRLIATGSNYCSDETSACPIGPVANSYPRLYQLHDRHGTPHTAYRMTLVVNPVLGQYYGVQGTTWQSPPILGSPTETRTVNGKNLLLYFNGHKLSVVAWKNAQGVYWVSNTLTDALQNSQLVGIAASLTRAGAGPGAPAR